MDEETANRFVSSLVKSIQALCNGYIDFSTSIEVIGHIHLNIDHNLKFNYILTEEVSKSVSEGATVFASHSYHSQPPPSVSSKTAGDASGRNRRKSHHVTQSNETDPLGITSLPAEVPNTSKSKSDNHSQGASRVGESSDSSQSGTGVSQDTDPVKQENNRSSCQVQESLDRRRRNALPSHRTPSPAAKRSRNNDTGSSTSVQNPGFDVIEIKEEPDDEPSVFFGDNSSHMAVGQDIQTPDFSNVVMESLDRVGQIEGNQLVAGGDSMQQQQQQPFPVMLHTNAGIPSSTMSSSGGQVPGPSSDPRSTASTSGASRGQFGRFDNPVPSTHATKDYFHHGGDDTQVSDEGVEVSALALSQHILEKGVGKNHRCMVCQRRHSQYLRDHPGTHPNSNPFKRSKTSFRCTLCKVYLCAQEERQCWWIWHQTQISPSGTSSSI